MSSLKMKQTFTILMLLLLLVLAGCKTSGTDRSKELELKEKDLALKEKELEAKEKASTESDSDKAETTETTETTEPVNKVYTPKANSAERNQIMDALRVPVEKDLKQSVIFKVNDLKVFGDWAFLGGEPINKASGKRPDLTGTKYDEENWEDYDNNIFALLKKKGGRWTLVEYAMMCSDVCYSNWWQSHGAPKAIFPYTE